MVVYVALTRLDGVLLCLASGGLAAGREAFATRLAGAALASESVAITTIPPCPEKRACSECGPQFVALQLELGELRY